VSYDDVERVLYPALRHRLILNFQAEAENITTDQVIGEVLKHVPRN
jgi:MoxR-like ATPase